MPEDTVPPTGLAPRRARAAPTVWQRAQPGDHLWVRETFRPAPDATGPSRVLYRADGHETDTTDRWRPSIHMPRWASRLTLDVTDVRRERLGDITDEDCLAEGIVRKPQGIPVDEPAIYAVETEEARLRDDVMPTFAHWARTPRDSFGKLVDRIYGERYRLDNPEVIVLGFTVQHRNIDAIVTAD